ncbi:malonate decarboxylase subunit epsilon [Nissabacter sp. SGAir0207]|uniref:malonate decarboxylase subunit epsilon n=1 Tax=Nissabacter sp. SGAir0207 TaxID=2126321 RepID=UPI0010CD6563|nr:malonate decarboxylase subunit epsilon [Nissabacter sp. SGAir0207]QCR38419.1 malonate decarboxylase subunit epsilon [Nissabacter sp. SGAir0207]
MKILFTFPGQGAQYPGMLAALPDAPTLASAREVLGDELATLDTPGALQHTRAVQLAVLIAGVAWGRALEARGVRPDLVSGLSIGAYPAAVIAGALAFEDALRLVALRGDVMEHAYPHGYGLTALSGLTLSQVETLVAQHDVYIANINADTQIVIAGSDQAMADAGRAALEAGATRAQRLAVSVPSHCALLDTPARQLAEAFRHVTLQRPRCGWLSGSTARVLWQPERIADDLAHNMARTVQWQEAMVAARERDARLAIEMPPGQVLTSLTRQSGWQGECVALEQIGLEGACQLAARLRRG